MLRLPTIAGCLIFAACATLGKPDLEELKPSIESFHQKIRWKDFRAAADLLVPERRESFIKARTRANDDKDLFITDFQLEDAKTSDDQLEAKVVSRVSWYRLPSMTEQTATITNVFVWRERRWELESQDAGPFPDLLGAPPAPATPEGARHNQTGGTN